MAPNSTIILCRHGQAEHNVTRDPNIHDATLTTLGRKQSTLLAKTVPHLQASVELICSSPLKRTLQTTKLAWAGAIDRLGIDNVICLPQAQECNAIPCDVGSPRAVLEASEEFRGFNFELLTPDWTSKEGFYAADPASLAHRAQWLRQFLRDRPEKMIVLVAHSDILRQITASGHGPSTQRWLNAECRLFHFDPATVDTEDCFLLQDVDITTAGTAGPESSTLVPRYS